ncbi:MAG: 23S rRNA (adenine(2503)-C(2))-methyltransferase RlmN [Candidatus Pacebacteria bacterium]|nr:23S rRNA (adenine(2503)-C(2))-methyltransferase RlmN [Candidatus Paceibacterota bacterium]
MTIEEYLLELGEPKFRLEQYHQAIYRQLIENWADFTSWPKVLREQVSAKFQLNQLKVLHQQISRKKDTEKVLFARNSNPKQLFEAVLMKHQDGRNTVCVSSMVGCPVGCTFCATGTMGFIANLTADEIVEQVLFFARKLQQDNQKVTNIVFMGMGEPLINFKNTMDAIDIFTDPKKMAMSPSRITISTSGIIQPMRKLLADDFKGRIAISLHAPSQNLRASIMPIANSNPLDQLMIVVDEFIAKNNKRISFEYILLKNVNDKQRHAEKLVKLIKGKLVHLNLIPYNPVPGFALATSDRKQIDRFAGVLKRARIPHTIRVSMGQDIDAACGQLATKKALV